MPRKAQIEKWKRPPKYPVRFRNRCKICGRPRGYIRMFGMCRMCFRKMAYEGLIPGVRKASW
ncbi:MAG: type Z 30S ribosomal protein S14 [Candidatus Calescibacterium sp.]|nr:type Z 30S ribosomal protein S14 [Candidatus Calescibacterium sp.]MCX7972713.1 type Z 30S ribosomal protein S14 [bacterium]MDW8195517.1 type Z 30S ribosomal protein S14 [Candidatus Calescibacterium sp.]